MAFLTPAQVSKLSNEDNTLRFIKQSLDNGTIGVVSAPELTVTPTGGLREFEPEAFTTIRRTTDNSLFRVRTIEKPRYMARVVSFNDPSGLQQGLPLFSDTPVSGGDSEVISPVVPKAHRKRRRRRGRKNKAA